jgi:maleylpyruvate isomerase
VSDVPTADIQGLADSHRRLAEHLSTVAAGDADPGRPSLLPSWTVGHVLTHIARNGDSMLRMLAGLPQYWKGFESRNTDIELGAGRSWSELVDDINATSAAVDRRMSEVVEWSGIVQATVSDRPKAMLPMLRRREVEVHRRDLGLGYGFEDMPSDYVRTDGRLMEMQWTARQPMGMTTLPAAVLALPEHDRLAWLMGRLDVPGVPPAGLY